MLAIGPVSALGEAVRADAHGWLRRIGGVCVQGQAEVEVEVEVGKGEGRLRPSASGFNLREDMTAAEAVFSLQVRERGRVCEVCMCLCGVRRCAQAEGSVSPQARRHEEDRSACTWLRHSLPSLGVVLQVGLLLGLRHRRYSALSASQRADGADVLREATRRTRCPSMWWASTRRTQSSSPPRSSCRGTTAWRACRCACTHLLC